MHAKYLMHMAYMIPGHLEDGFFFWPMISGLSIFTFLAIIFNSSFHGI